jgi:tetratricopeptide (TPR) repeat protein
LAEVEYGKAIALDPSNPRLYERRANCRLEGSRLGEALDDCRQGLELEPTNARLDWMRSLIYWRTEEYDAALGSALEYARKAPEDDQGHFNLAAIYSRMRRYDDAILSLDKAIGRNPFEARFYLERASIYYHRMFDRTRAADDLAQWLLYAGAEKPEHERSLLLGELDGFDDEMRARALEQYEIELGSSRYLS